MSKYLFGEILGELRKLRERIEDVRSEASPRHTLVLRELLRRGEGNVLDFIGNILSEEENNWVYDRWAIREDGTATQYDAGDTSHRPETDEEYRHRLVQLLGLDAEEKAKP